MDIVRVGVVGLGNMGIGMAASLARNGFHVSGFDIDDARRAPAAAAGAAFVPVLTDLLQQADAVVFSLPYARDVAAVVTAAGGLLSRRDRKVIVIDTSTSDPATSRRLAAQLADAGHALLDAPVSGGPSYPFSLPPLPYATSANAPSIDAQTMEIHHDKHHAAYVANLNAAVKDYPKVAAMPLGDMLGRLGELPDGIRTAVRNNGGGHANHSMFWTVMGGNGGDPSGEVAAGITRDFGSFAQLKDAFNKAGAGQFGSGWAMVLVDGSGKLTLTARPNQDSPLLDGKTVLFGNDVWEHAYYLKYQNRRPDYLAAWWNVLNWPVIEQRYSAARAGTLVI